VDSSTKLVGMLSRSYYATFTRVTYQGGEFLLRTSDLWSYFRQAKVGRLLRYTLKGPSLILKPSVHGHNFGKSQTRTKSTYILIVKADSFNYHQERNEVLSSYRTSFYRLCRSCNWGSLWSTEVFYYYFKATHLFAGHILHSQLHRGSSL
jgi:hypothetical protein